MLAILFHRRKRKNKFFAGKCGQVQTIGGEKDVGNDHINHDMDNSSERDRHSSCVDKELVKNSKEVDKRIGPSWAEIVSNKMCEGRFHNVENGLDKENMDQMTNRWNAAIKEARKALELGKSLGMQIEGDESEAVPETMKYDGTLGLLHWFGRVHPVMKLVGSCGCYGTLHSLRG
ncbi:hypothetical protein V6N11_061896 [Hibiscus sabdariffa]|uniref:Uncharacterized protein n=1 Tax=Hibiscus sabdariffa TaxID=183260 RepID=A0ABR2N7E6_9ROSI